MSTVIRTLVGLKIGTETSTLVPIQSQALANNNEFMQLKATSSIGHDLVAHTKRMPELTFETNALAKLTTALGGGIYKVDDIEYYLGKFAATPSEEGYYFDTTGVSVKKMTGAVIYIDTISGDIGEPITCTFKTRGNSVATSTDTLESFTISHGDVHTISTLTFGAKTVGIRNFSLETGIEFYDYFENGVDPEVSAITNADLRATCRILIDSVTDIEAIETVTDFVLNLNKYQAGGLPQIAGGTITFNDCVVKVESDESRIGDVAIAEISLRPTSVEFDIVEEPEP